MRAGTTDKWLPLWGVAALWTPAMIAASYGWRNGDYYDYGWFVPPAALWLMVRRWSEFRQPCVLPGKWQVWTAVALLLPWILVLRILGYADPSWRLPMGLLGVTAVAGSHLLIGVSQGRRASAGFVWITLLWMSAIPWPSVVESGIVHRLTGAVIASVAEVFRISGVPVEVAGDRLRLHDLTVGVTDGCSGVRSFQSFVMATWFFAELQRLRASRALTLLVCACGAAFVVNTVRAYSLARIRFDLGEQAFNRAHDWLGLLAFLVCGVFFYQISGLLSPVARRGAAVRPSTLST